jgi:hypothetical protein
MCELRNRHYVLTTLLLSLMGGLGCSKPYPIAQVSGRVECDGKPVIRAAVLFSPLAKGKAVMVGKQGYGNTDDKGNFVLSTYGHQDGAVIGKHSVIVANPEVPCECVATDRKEVMQVDVEPGIENTFLIQLLKKTGKEVPERKSSSSDDE